MTLDESLIERLEKVFPYYLNAAEKRRLSEHIGSFPDDRDYYASSWEGPPEPLQGDGWNGFIKIDFSDATRHHVAGIILSNSCDIDEANKSLRDRNILFAPILPLNSYEQHLREAGISDDRISSHLEALRRQDKSDVFYLPASQNTPEAIVVLDDISSQPLSSFMETHDRRMLFRLNPYGFYVFLMKLSIHFTRLGEEVQRGY